MEVSDITVSIKLNINIVYALCSPNYSMLCVLVYLFKSVNCSVLIDKARKRVRMGVVA